MSYNYLVFNLNYSIVLAERTHPRPSAELREDDLLGGESRLGVLCEGKIILQLPHRMNMHTPG